MSPFVIGSTSGGPGNMHLSKPLQLLLNIFFKDLTFEILCHFYFYTLVLLGIF